MTGIGFQYVAAAATASEIWDVMEVPIASVESVLMGTEACVDAALQGLDTGEFITLPFVHDDTLISKFEGSAHSPAGSHADRRTRAALHLSRLKPRSCL